MDNPSPDPGSLPYRGIVVDDQHAGTPLRFAREVSECP
jgi:hypothetical protein